MASEAWTQFINSSDEEQAALAWQALDAVVTEAGPEYVYPKILCTYVLVGEQHSALQWSCLIGHVLGRLGLDVADVLDADLDGGVPAENLGQWLPDGDLIADTVLAMWQTAQNTQDLRGTWGEAREAARASVAEVLQ